MIALHVKRVEWHPKMNINGIQIYKRASTALLLTIHTSTARCVYKIPKLQRLVVSNRVRMTLAAAW